MKLILMLFLLNSSIYCEVMIYKIKGNVSVLSDKNEKKDAKTGDYIKEGYSVATENNSEAELLIGDYGIVVLYENSRFVIGTKINQEKDLSFIDTIFGIKKLYAVDNNSNIDYLYGKATFFIKKLVSKKYSVRTPAAVCGVRGTSFAIISDDKTSEVGLFKGILDIVRDNESKTLNPGQTAYVSRTDIKINERLSKIMEKEKKRAEKLEKYFDNVRKKIEDREKKLNDKLSKRNNKTSN